MAAPPVPPDRHLPMPRPAPSTTYYNGPPPGFHPGAFLPGEVGTTYGPTNPAPPPYPGWMSPSDLMAEAQKEAQAFYGPLLAELHRQQTQLHNHNLAQQAAIQGVFQAIQGGLSGPYAQIAGNEGQLGYLGAVQDANQSEQDLAFKVMQLAQEASGKQGDFLGALQDQQASLAGDYQKAHTPTIHGSLTTGLYATYPDGTIKILRPPSGSGAAPKLTSRVVNGQVVWFDPTTGQPVGDPYGTKTPPKTRALPNLQFKDIGGSLWAVDPRTGRKIRNLGPSGTTAEPNVDLPLSRAMHAWVDDAGKPIASLAGVPLPRAASRAVRPPSAASVRAGWKIVGDGYYHAPGSSRRLTNAEIQQRLDKINVAREQKNLPPITPAMIPAMTAQQRRVLGIAGQPRNPQDVYIDLIHSGIPAYRAWQMVRRSFPNFGSDYFPGKGAAAAEPAAGFGTRLVTFAKKQLGQPYVWGAESRKEGGFDCSGLVDWALRQEGYNGDRVTTWTLRKMGQHVVRKNIQPGDLIITNNGKHVVIYAGDGQVVAGSSAQGRVVMQPLSNITINEIRRMGPAPKPVREVAARSSGRVPQQQASLAQKFGTQFGIDPLLLLAIGGHETEWGTTGAGRQGYTLGYGATDSGTISKYRGVRNQYYWAAKLLASWGVRTLQDILAGKASRYASDPGWEQGVASVYNSLANTV